MPSGTGASVLSTLPDVPYTIDPVAFAQLTEKNVQPLDQFPTPGPGNAATFYLPKSGVVSQLRMVFNGSLTVTAAVAGQTQPIPSARWPYGLLGNFKLSAGLGAEIWDASGLDLTALNHALHPFVSELVDQYPGAVGGGGAALAAGVYPLYLNFDVPIATDQTSLIASIFCQSSSANVAGQVFQAVMSDLIEPGGTAALWTIAGTWTPVETVWAIPLSKSGLILPDISHVHIGAGINQAFTGTGRQPAMIQRTAGVLQRLFLRAENTRTSFLSALPSTPSDALIDEIRINYGLTQTPLVFNPASTLASLNNRWYGSPLPYDTYCYDTVRENAVRDAILLAGVTELQAQVYVDPAVVVETGAYTRVFEEILV